MSRCDCCGKVLSDYEMSLKGKLSGQYLNMSLSCIKAANIAYTGNASLKRIASTEHEPEYKTINLNKPKWEVNEYSDD